MNSDEGRSTDGSAWSTKPIPTGLGRAWLLTIIFVIVSYVYFDRPLAIWIAHTLPKDWLTLLRVVTFFGKAEIYIVVCLLGLATLYVARKRWLSDEVTRLWFDYAWLMLISLAASGVVVNVLKPLLGRLRPRYLLSQSDYGLQPFNLDMGMNSFPSGHSQTIWAVCMSLILLLAELRSHRQSTQDTNPPGCRFKVLITLIFAAGISIALSRVLLNAHYLSDVVAGSLLGASAALLLQKPVLHRVRNLFRTGPYYAVTATKPHP